MMRIYRDMSIAYDENYRECHRKWRFMVIHSMPVK